MGLRLASINLHCGLDRRGHPYSVKAAVAALNTDVILVQENWRPDGSPSLAASAAADCGYPCLAELDLVADTPLAGLDVVRGDVPDETGAWGLAILSRLPWRGCTTVEVGAVPGDVVGPRLAQVVEIPLDDSAVLRVVNVHLTHRLAHGPAQLRRLIAGLGDRSVPTVIAGDLNLCRPTVYLARPYRPAVRGRTWPAHRPMVQIDHALVGAGVTATAPRVGPDVGSDHRPVQVTLDAAGRDGGRLRREGRRRSVPRSADDRR
jgi:endonuclease/exonuclease/phosphatase family metal-dependent hydrolase